MVRADGWLEWGRSTMECVRVGWAGGSREVLSCWELVVGEGVGREGFADEELQ